MASSSPSEALLPCFLPYERQRDARLAENRKRMEALGLLDLSHSLSISARRTPKKISKPSARLPTPPVVAAPSRRSSRLQGTTQPCYREVDRESDVNARAVTTDSRQCQPEVYSEEDEKLLGHCNEDWELFKDGFAADGTRIYDSINGKTCHQCRQKTLGLRTWCNKCESLRGQFCGDCLFMRAGMCSEQFTHLLGKICGGSR